MNDAKVINNLANNMLTNPSNLSGLRPAPANSNAAPTQGNTAAPAAQPQSNTAAAPAANTAVPAANANASTTVK